MNYRSYADLAQVIVHNLYRLPSDIDVVVGIPRSGLLAANMISLSRNLPLADLQGFSQSRVLSSGRTKDQASIALGSTTYKHALVIDDSINSGKSMQEARDILAASPVFADRVTFAAVYGRPDKENLGADIVFETIGLPRYFEWNIFHHKDLSRMCFDIDGVLCHDPERDQNDDGE
ncbi:hypothetical protein LTR94_025040, partial [Friedmanniomyces endolithicus]